MQARCKTPSVEHKDMVFNPQMLQIECSLRHFSRLRARLLLAKGAVLCVLLPEYELPCMMVVYVCVCVCVLSA